MVYAKTPLAGLAAVLDYLSRYTHRAAIGNERIVGIDAQQVILRVRDKDPAARHGARGRCAWVARSSSAASRVVDEHILPAALVRTENGRTFTRLAAAFARFYFRTEDQFVARLRLRILEELTARLELRGDKDLVFDLAVLPNDLSWRVELPYGGLADATEAIQASVNRVQQVKEANRLVSTDPDVMGACLSLSERECRWRTLRPLWTRISRSCAS